MEVPDNTVCLAFPEQIMTLHWNKFQHAIHCYWSFKPAQSEPAFSNSLCSQKTSERETSHRKICGNERHDEICFDGSDLEMFCNRTHSVMKILNRSFSLRAQSTCTLVWKGTFACLGSLSSGKWTLKIVHFVRKNCRPGRVDPLEKIWKQSDSLRNFSICQFPACELSRDWGMRSATTMTTSQLVECCYIKCPFTLSNWRVHHGQMSRCSENGSKLVVELWLGRSSVDCWNRTSWRAASKQRFGGRKWSCSPRKRKSAKQFLGGDVWRKQLPIENSSETEWISFEVRPQSSSVSGSTKFKRAHKNIAKSWNWVKVSIHGFDKNLRFICVAGAGERTESKTVKFYCKNGFWMLLFCTCFKCLLHTAELRKLSGGNDFGAWILFLGWGKTELWLFFEDIGIFAQNCEYYHAYKYVWPIAWKNLPVVTSFAFDINFWVFYFCHSQILLCDVQIGKSTSWLAEKEMPPRQRRPVPSCPVPSPSHREELRSGQRQLTSGPRQFTWGWT